MMVLALMPGMLQAGVDGRIMPGRILSLAVVFVHLMIDESAWVIQAHQGDQEAFTRLVEIFPSSVYNLCYLMLGVSEP